MQRPRGKVRARRTHAKVRSDEGKSGNLTGKGKGWAKGKRRGRVKEGEGRGRRSGRERGTRIT